MSMSSVKPVSALYRGAEPGALERVLGPVSLSTLGIGDILRAGIFVPTGQAAAQHAGPAIVLSSVIVGIACMEATG